MSKVITKFPIRYAECRKEEKQSERRNEEWCEWSDKLANMGLEETHQTK